MLELVEASKKVNALPFHLVVNRLNDEYGKYYVILPTLERLLQYSTIFHKEGDFEEAHTTRIMENLTRTIHVTLPELATTLIADDNYDRGVLQTRLLTIWSTLIAEQEAMEVYPRLYIPEVSFDGQFAIAPNLNQYIQLESLEDLVDESCDADFLKLLLSGDKPLQVNNPELLAKIDRTKKQYSEYFEGLSTYVDDGVDNNFYDLQMFAVTGMSTHPEAVSFVSESLFCILALMVSEDFRTFVRGELRQRCALASSLRAPVRFLQQL